MKIIFDGKQFEEALEMWDKKQFAEEADKTFVMEIKEYREAEDEI